MIVVTCRADPEAPLVTVHIEETQDPFAVLECVEKRFPQSGPDRWPLVLEVRRQQKAQAKRAR